MNKFGVDENGIILTEVSADKITSAYRSIVEDVLHSILQEFESQIDSIYV